MAPAFPRFVPRSMLPSRWLTARGAFALAAILVTVGRAEPSSEDDRVAYSIKGAYLFNFTRFIEWPVPDHVAANSFTIGLLGFDQPAIDAIQQTLRGKRTGDGRTIEVQTYSEVTSDLAKCQLVFVGESEMNRVQAVQTAVGDRPVLIVGETEGAARRGCAINFVVAGDSVRIEINLQRAQRAGLKLSGRLANVATLVRDAQTN